MESAVDVDAAVDNLHDVVDDPVVEARYSAVVGAAGVVDNDDSATQVVESHNFWGADDPDYYNRK